MIDFSQTILRKSGKQNYLNVWVVCDICGLGRWCQRNNAIVLPSGQPCKSCSNSAAADYMRKHKGGEKQCSRCKNVLPISEFTKRIDRPDSYRGRCNSCMAKEAIERRRNNPDIVKEQHRQGQRNRRARLSQGIFTREDWKEILDRYNYKCLRCGSENDLQPDHVIPLSVGGNNTKDNIQPLCGSCNRRKQANIADYRISA